MKKNDNSLLTQVLRFEEITIENNLVNNKFDIFEAVKVAALELKDLEILKKLVAAGVLLDTLNEDSEATILDVALEDTQDPSISLYLIANGAKFTPLPLTPCYEGEKIYSGTKCRDFTQSMENLINNFSAEDYAEKLGVSRNINFLNYDDPQPMLQAVSSRIFQIIDKFNPGKKLNTEKNVLKILAETVNHCKVAIAEVEIKNNNLEHGVAKPYPVILVRMLKEAQILSELFSSQNQVSLRKFNDDFFSNAGITKNTEGQIDNSLFGKLPNEVLSHIVSYVTLDSIDYSVPGANIVESELCGDNISNIEHTN